jgi:Protein of unknown function (DUF1302)
MRQIYGVLGAILLASAPVCSQDLDISTTLETRYVYGTQSGKSQSAEVEIRPVWELTLSDSWSFQGGARLRTDAFDRLEVGRPNQDIIDPLSRRVLIGQTTELELREAFLQYAGDFTTVRLGKQQIVWGRADGIKVLDIVNPQSFREFILDDFDQSRTPLWSLLVEQTIAGLDVQGFWLFDQTFNEAPPRGSVFAITAPEFVPTFLAPPTRPVFVNDINRPSNRFGDSEFGLQVSGLAGNWNFSLNFLHTFEDTPFFDFEGLDDRTIITPRLNRVNILGGSFANSWGEFTLRGEATYTFNEDIPVGFQESAGGVQAESDVIKYVIGLDYVGIQDTFISAQFFQLVKLTGFPTALVPRAEEFTTLFVRHTLDDSDMTLDFRWYANHDSNDGIIRAHISRQITDQMKVSFGGDFFYGRKTGVFGQFNEADRLSLTFLYVY